jgi:hypothetical protein
MLVIVGGHDRTSDSAETRRRLASFAPRAEVRFLPDAGHFIPDQTDVIARFLGGRSA